MFCACLLTLWASRLDETQIREWQRRTLPAEFRGTFLEESDFEGRQLESDDREGTTRE
ncbi:MULTISPECIES: hypothetical protein [Haloferacaceae]|uniref:Uncharacterized protein n=1 Tax=Halorubrum glutamatedens TaxID=2707018 RepID=A0ABD5QPA3_9EURY|nr:hypothetical protein [Halobellus captivus]